MTPVVSQGSRGINGVQGQGPGTAIKAQHGCLEKMDTRSEFGAEYARGG